MNKITSLVSKLSKYGALAAAVVATAQQAVAVGLVPASALPWLVPALAYAAGHLGHSAPQKS